VSSDGGRGWEGNTPVEEGNANISGKIFEKKFSSGFFGKNSGKIREKIFEFFCGISKKIRK
jgi:hypothetical protein